MYIISTGHIEQDQISQRTIVHIDHEQSYESREDCRQALAAWMESHGRCTADGRFGVMQHEGQRGLMVCWDDGIAAFIRRKGE